MAAPPRFKEALEILAKHRVDLVVVGGVAAVLNGAPIATFDLDVVHSRSPDNLDRLAGALEDLEARYRDMSGLELRPEAAALAGDGHHLLLTRCGPVDVLGQIGNGRCYDDLLPDAVTLNVGDAIVRVLGLSALIRAKEEAGRDKDLAVLGILRRTLLASGKK